MNFSRPNWAQIDLAALRHNARQIAHHAAPARLVAVIKANAYGHGAIEVARALQREPSVTFFGVASVDEGVALRDAGIDTKILLLSAILPSEAEEVVRADLTPTVYTRELANALNRAAARQNQTLNVHFKIDTGMARLGVDWCDAHALWPEISALENLKITGIYTHMACADESVDEMSPLQLKRFDEAVREISPAPNVLRHTANSAATLRYRESHFDLVRPGIALYGSHPCPQCAPDLGLKAVMSWRARVTSLKTIEAGRTVSYGAIWTAPRASRIAVVSCGYADGYPRRLSNCGEVWLNGARAKVVGRVTMDQILLDVTEIQAQIGDEVTLWGEGMVVDEVAARADTISYELLCGVSSRVPRVYVVSSE